MLNENFHKLLKDNRIDKIFVDSNGFTASDFSDRLISNDRLLEDVTNYFSCLHGSSEYSKITMYVRIKESKNRYIKKCEFICSGSKEAIIICDKELINSVKGILKDLGYDLNRTKKLKRK